VKPGPDPLPETLLFVRHGATAYNLANLRCGGDIDTPLVDAGRGQAQALAAVIRERRPRPGIIVTSALARTHETARIVADAVGLEIVVEPRLAERLLGGWNGVPAGTLLPWFEPGVEPPGGGESNEQFIARIAAALRHSLVPRLPQRPLLVGSRGVARVLGLLCGKPLATPVANAAMLEFPTAPLLALASDRWNARGISAAPSRATPAPPPPAS